MSVRLEPMTPERYLAWIPETISGFVAQQTAAGAMPGPEAVRYAEGEFDKLLPDGLLTRDQHIWSAYDGAVEVGYLWLGVREQSHGADAFVFDVAVDPDLRGRGHGRAIMLAAEAEARALGAVELKLNVFGHNVAAQHLYDGLGYEPASTQMARRLDTTEPLTFPGGPGVRLEPMTQEQFDTYRAQAEESYAASIAGSGMLPVAEAREKSAADFAHLLPDGLDTPEQLFWTAYDGPRDVGLVWLNIRERSDGLFAFGYDFLVREELRRHGYGRAIMVAGERLCRDRGVATVGLNVFGHNPGARTLYEQMGFEVTATLLRKPLP